MYNQYLKAVRIPKILVHNFKFYLWVVLVAHTIFIFQYRFFRKVIFAAFNRGICNNVLSLTKAKSTNKRDLYSKVKLKLKVSYNLNNPTCHYM